MKALAAWAGAGAFLALAGLLLFSKGFLLTRRQCALTSDDKDFPSGESPFVPPKHLFLFIVDALRLDFMREVQPGDRSDSAGRRSGVFNRFSVIHNLLRNNRSQSALFGFRAEPPTVTAQRLQALVTGGIPTFLDIGTNFNAENIVEDSWIRHIKKSGKRLVFLGDDTWMALFPSTFDAALPFESFDTRDLYTVDRGIEEVLFDEMDKEWGLFVVHFLGVDHVGHSFSAFHPLMEERLTAMNRLLGEVIERLPEDSLLLMFGDHGMTDAGEHGGASPEEVDSGLFVYRKHKDHQGQDRVDRQTAGSLPDWTQLRHELQMTMQIDLVPTLSIVMGLPIPFSNLGTVVPRLLQIADGFQDARDDRLVYALYQNAMQVMRYLVQYSCDVKLFPSSARTGSSEPLSKAIGSISLPDLQEVQEKLLKARAVCSGTDSHHVGHRSVFSLHEMTGLFDLLLKAVADHEELVAADAKGDASTALESYMTFLQKSQQLGREQWTQFNVPLMFSACLMVVALTAVFCCCVYASQPFLSLNAVGVYVAGAAVLSMCHAGSMLSNSFIVEEHWLALYALQTCNVLMIGAATARMASPMKRASARLGTVVGWGSLLCLSTRGMWQYSSSEYGQFIDLSSVNVQIVPLLLLVSLYLFGLSLVAKTDSKAAAHVVLFIMEHACIMLYWTFPGVAFGGQLGSILFPRTAITFSVLSILWTTVDSLSRSGDKSAIVHLFFHVSSLLYLLGGTAHSFVLPLLSAYLGLSVYIMVRLLLSFAPGRLGAEAGSIAGRICVSCGVHLSLLGRFLYFCYGQRMNFSSLHLSVGLIGTPEFNMYHGGALMAMHVLGPDLLTIIGAFAIPRLYTHVSQMAGGHESKAVDNNAFEKISNGVLYGFLCHRLCLAAFATVCGLLHRRHLMVWAIFAPKVMFESFFAVVFFSFLGVFFVLPSRSP